MKEPLRRIGARPGGLVKLKRAARMGGVPLCESWTSMVREVRVVERGREWSVGVPGRTGGKRE